MAPARPEMAYDRGGRPGLVEPLLVEPPEGVEGRLVDGEDGGLVAPAPAAEPPPRSGRHPVELVAQQAEALVLDEACLVEGQALGAGEGGGEDALVALGLQQRHALLDGRQRRRPPGRGGDVGDAGVAAPGADAEAVAAQLHGVELGHGSADDQRHAGRPPRG